jgi:carbonic anhydrase
MGHEGCGAVKSACQSLERIENEPEHLKGLLLNIKSHLDLSRVNKIQSPRARDREAVVANTVEQMHRLLEVCAVYPMGMQAAARRVLCGQWACRLLEACVVWPMGVT